MGEQLRTLFARAHEKGGVALAGKLALKTRLNSSSAAAAPDDPATVAMATQALNEFLRELGTGVGVAPASAPSGPAAARGGKIQGYFDFARQKGGIQLVVKLAARTGITSAAAATLPDDPAKLHAIRSALAELLPGVGIPAL